MGPAFAGFLYAFDIDQDIAHNNFQVVLGSEHLFPGASAGWRRGDQVTGLEWPENR